MVNKIHHVKNSLPDGEIVTPCHMMIATKNHQMLQKKKIWCYKKKINGYIKIIQVLQKYDQTIKKKSLISLKLLH